MKNKLPQPLTEDELAELDGYEHTIAAGSGIFCSTLQALGTIYAKRLWRQHANFRDYVEDLIRRQKWEGISSVHLWRMAKAIEVRDNLKSLPIGNVENEAQARELAKLPKKKQRKIWALAKAAEATNGQLVTASRLKELIASAGEQPKDKPGPSRRDRFMLRMAKRIERDRRAIASEFGEDNEADSILDQLWEKLTEMAAQELVA